MLKVPNLIVNSSYKHQITITATHYQSKLHQQILTLGTAVRLASITKKLDTYQNL